MSDNSVRSTITCVYSPTHARQDAVHEVQYGVKINTYDQPERAEAIRRTLSSDATFQFTDAADHGTDPIVAVHDPGLVAFLRDAWSEWRAHGGLQGGPQGVEEVFPDTVLHPALREGMGPATEPAVPIGRIGYWCWETMTALVPGSYDAARAAVNVALTAADRVLSGDAHAYGLCRPSGHHSPRRAFGGNCFFNNAAITAQYLAQATGGQVAILDVDYHHGNGTQQIFYDRGDVLYCSLHADPSYAYPYFVGHASETGIGSGEGATLNLPLDAGCADETYLQMLKVALDRISDFEAEVLIVSLGLDTFGRDPIGNFALTTDVYHTIGSKVSALGRPTVVLQEGGYYIPALGLNVQQWLRGLTGQSALLHGVERT